MVYRFIFFTVICLFSDCLAVRNIFTVNSVEKGSIDKQECTTVQDILRCKSASFEYNGSTIKADNIYSDVIIDGIAMIKFIADLNYFIENKEKDSAAGEVESLTQKVSSLEKELQNKKKENDSLKPKAEFLDDHILIVNGSIFKKTYHKYGCDKIDYSSFKAYNKEQVQGKFGFTPCSHCIK